MMGAGCPALTSISFSKQVKTSLNIFIKGLLRTDFAYRRLVDFQKISEFRHCVAVFHVRLYDHVIALAFILDFAKELGK
ncbi:MAG: hypothetical protein CVT63_05890 [Candidatus Anoxymicrobium japonicum]|uniref:Uncharacterized protein n=1 Tax=Candidatus Anoxymicrobium japonicum TaxID=2013648 RepID=A0A2N3G5D4_9ACTN|nr:MAG: hypothetical protein CVT63_05890 [Candidatus Anoxymicrobium japonicum]